MEAKVEFITLEYKTKNKRKNEFLILDTKLFNSSSCYTIYRVSQK